MSLQRQGQSLRGNGGETSAQFLAECKDEWANLSRQEQARYSREAKQKNALAFAQRVADLVSHGADADDVLAGGPWGLSEFDSEFPLAEGKLDECLQTLGGLRGASSVWKQETVAQSRKDFRLMK